MIVNLSSCLNLARPLCVFDLETTGTNDDARIVQLAVTLHYPQSTASPHRSAIAWHTYVNPEILVPLGAVEVHGITDEMVADSPTFKDLVDNRLMERAFSNVDYAGHNVTFDLKVMKNECARVGHPWNWENDDSMVVDTLRVFQLKHPRNLEAAHQEYLGYGFEGAHGAPADVAACERVLAAQLERHTDLPRTVAELSMLLSGDKVDKLGKLRWQAGEAQVAFGKHQGKSLRQAIAEDRQYFSKFVVGGDFPADFKRVVTAALGGVFPKRVTT